MTTPEPVSYELQIEFPPYVKLQYQLAPQQTLSEIRTLLLENTVLSMFEQFAMYCGDRRLSEVSEISALQIESKSTIEVRLQPYQERSARNHVLKVYEVITDPKLATLLLSGHKQKMEQDLTALSKKMGEEIDAKLGCAEAADVPLQTILKPSLSNPLFQIEENEDYPSCVTFMSFSGYNPPPGKFRLQGHFFYLNVRTLQLIDYHITACARGFFINNSNSCHFDPTQHSAHKKVYYCLIDLLKAVSAKFKTTYETITAWKMTQSDKIKFTRTFPYHLTVPRWLGPRYQDCSWDPLREIEPDRVRQTSFMVSVKDWNQLFLAQKEMPSQSYLEKANKHKFSVKLYMEYIQAAVQGAIKMVDRSVAPLNPAQTQYEQIFVNSNMFFSSAKQNPLSFEQQRGLNACSSSSGANVDLRNLGILHKHPIQDLYPLQTVIVDYKGSRILAQNIIPGILTSVQCCQYGSMDDGKTIMAHPEFQIPFQKLCRLFRLQQQVSFSDGEGNNVQLAGSMDVKGILGSDKKKYLVDLLRLSVRDLNYPGDRNTACMIRQELLDLYYSQTDNKDAELQELVDKANDIVGTGRLNPSIDTNAPLVKNQNYEQQENSLKKIALFLRQKAIPKLVSQLKQQSNFMKLADSSSLAKLFHSSGVNMRYLGQVFRQDLPKHLKIIIERVILVKSLKHLFKKIMRGSAEQYLMDNLLHALNSIFSTKSQIQVLEKEQSPYGKEVHADSANKKKHKKKKAVVALQDFDLMVKDIPVQVNAFSGIKPSQLWQQTREIAKARYSHDLPQKITDFSGFGLPFNKLAALRDLCISVGIVLVRQDYEIDERIQKSAVFPFTAGCISKIIPVVKHIDLADQQVSNHIQKGESLFAEYKVEQSIQHFQMALHMLTSIYGGVHRDMASVYSRIGLIHYRLGDFQSAIFYESSALAIMRLICQEDNPEVAVALFNLGLYYYGTGDHKKALFLTQKSLYISNLIGGQAYPESILTFMNMSTIYQSIKQHQSAISILLQTKERVSLIYPPTDYTHAACHQALAAVHYQIGDLLKAIHFQDKACQMANESLGPEHPRAQDAVALLTRFKQEINNHRVQEQPKKQIKKERPVQKPQPGDMERNMLLDKLRGAIVSSQMARQQGFQQMGMLGRRR